MSRWTAAGFSTDRYVHPRIAENLVSLHVEWLYRREHSEADFTDCPLAKFADSPARLIYRSKRGTTK